MSGIVVGMPDLTRHRRGVWNAGVTARLVSSNSGSAYYAYTPPLMWESPSLVMAPGLGPGITQVRILSPAPFMGGVT